ncbi:hypothetical protein Tco_0952567 [Tanacetum coccineum]|uniref:Uncharacterized protein n=1 Tax=Tanacetum coccineum TaxID=301880 RepID=A0ABQ5DY52_9ASTR
MGLWYRRILAFELTTFSDADHAVALYCKSTLIGIHVLSCCSSPVDEDTTQAYGFQLQQNTLYAILRSAIANLMQPRCGNSRTKLIHIAFRRKVSDLVRRIDLPSRYQVYQGRLLARFQDDAKYEQRLVKTQRSQGWKRMIKTARKDLKIRYKVKSKDMTKAKDQDHKA